MQGAGGVSYRESFGGVVEPRLVRSAHEFEAQMMKELIQPMTRLNGDDEPSGAGEALTDFASEALGQSLSRAGGFGIAERLISELSQNGASHAGTAIPERSRNAIANH